MKTLFLAWRDPGQRWYPIGRLSFSDQKYRFVYLEGAIEAQEHAGFRPLPAFSDMTKVHESETLFPVFANRLPSPSREEFSSFVEWLSLDAGERDPLVLLARSTGHRETDMFEVFECPEPDERGMYSMHAFVHGLRHRTPEAIEMAKSLKAGDALRVTADPENRYDSLAIQAHTADGEHHLGYLPRYLSPELHRLGLDAVSASVVRVNPPPAPMQFRLLTRLEAAWPEGFAPCSGPEFFPLAVTAAC